MRLALASGLRLGAGTTRRAELLLLQSYLLGSLGTAEDRSTAESLQVLLLAGGLHAEEEGEGAPKRRRFSTAAEAPAAQRADEADLFLAPLAQRLRLYVQTGEGDCGVSTFLPQRAMPRSIFPRSVRSGKLHLWPNPNSCCLGGLQVVGHAGQPLALALRPGRLDLDVWDGMPPFESAMPGHSSKGEKQMDWLLKSWQKQHLAPLWPELLMNKAEVAAPRRAAAPNAFNIDLSPEAEKVLLFSGNSKSAEWELIAGEESASPLGQKDVLSVCIPSFQEEPCILLVDSQALAPCTDLVGGWHQVNQSQRFKQPKLRACSPQLAAACVGQVQMELQGRNSQVGEARANSVEG
ncbi:unnamed protein product [Durusdinium trenchii]|uniref:DNA polymerase alpha/delta/epsilon subunit B domain-containing protein n=1 Tax=Durusdinium trenchii TaxID=1381693 RepID=A0ABP0N7F0_9DINO